MSQRDGTRLAHERQLTHAPRGHTLNGRQAVSPDGCWLAFDTRNDDTHIARTDSIERVHVVTGEVQSIYRLSHSTEHGPGVGAVVYHPREDRVLFIHGLNCCHRPEYPYQAVRRFGAIVRCDGRGAIEHAESRSVRDPHRVGSLRGGTHAHSWSHDGEWISCTYNDACLADAQAKGIAVCDRRTVVAMRRSMNVVNVGPSDDENFGGGYLAAPVTDLVDHAHPGSDEIEQAVEECWVGLEGYRLPSGYQQRAIAFLGAVRTEEGWPIQEVYVSDIPEWDGTGAFKGSGIRSNERLPSMHVRQRRLTCSPHRKYPGVQGVRHWLCSSPDGLWIYFLMRDDLGCTQLFRASTSDAGIGPSREEPLTDLPSSIESQIALDAHGDHVSFVAGQSVCTLEIRTGIVTRWTTPDAQSPVVGAVHFVGNTGRLAYNRFVPSPLGQRLQIFILER